MTSETERCASELLYALSMIASLPDWHSGASLLEHVLLESSFVEEAKVEFVPSTIDFADAGSLLEEPSLLLIAHNTSIYGWAHIRLVDKDEAVQFAIDIRNSLRLLAILLSEREQQEKLRNDKDKELAKLALVAEHAGDIVIITNADHSIEWVNPAFVKLTGYTLAEVAGKQPSHVLNGPLTDPDTVAEIWAALERNEGVRRTLLNYRKDGSTYWIELDIRPIHDSEGKIVQLVAIERDVTERIREQEERDKLAMRLQLATAAADLGVYEYNVQAHTVSIDEIAARHLGLMCGAGVLCIEQWAAALCAEDRPAFYEIVERLDHICQSGNLLGEDNIQSLWRTWRIPTSSGTTKYIHVMGNLSQDSMVTTHKVSGIIRDVTEQVQTQQTVSHASKMEAVARLAGCICHDLNNILGILQSSLELGVMKRQDPLSVEKHGMVALQAVRRGSDLTKRLSRLSKLQVIETATYNLNMIVRDFLPLIQQAAGPRVDVQLSLCSNELPVMMDSGLFEDALLNLTFNARDAMPNGGNLKITTEFASHKLPEQRETKPAAIIRVSDTGNGISEEIRSRIFEPFFSTKSPSQGTGLGLAMVHSFARQSGGSVTVKSKEGVGSTFEIILPITKGDIKTIIHQEDSTLSKTPTSLRRLLIIDDEADLRSQIAIYFNELGVECYQASGYEEALALLKTIVPCDAVLTDFMLGSGHSGLDLAHLIRQQYPNVPVIIITGHADPDLRETMSRVDFQILMKPISLVDLHREIESVVSKTKAQ